MLNFVPQAMGWLPDLPDARDFTFRNPYVLSLLRRLKWPEVDPVPDSIDLRQDSEGEYFGPVEDQGKLNSSTAFAALNLFEYFERRIGGRCYQGSKLFLYQITRNHIDKRVGVTADVGADLRSTLKMLCHIGVPPEEYWPYIASRFHQEPGAFQYAIAKPQEHIRYFRLDEPNRTGEMTWRSVKSFLAAGFPVVFGVSIPKSLTGDSAVPYRPGLDAVYGGQAFVAVGYDSNYFGKRQDAILIRSSWGTQWGDNGNGWLPVAYLRNQLATCFWTMISETWLDSEELFLPSVVASHE